MLININPKILGWAREERFGQMPLKNVAEKIGIDLYNLEKWENEGTEIPFEVLEAIAKSYKRQTAVFFLPTIPPKTKKIKDFRNIAVNGGKFSPEALLAIRRTERYLGVTRDLESVTYWNKKYLWIKDFTGKQDVVDEETIQLRKLLGVSLDGCFDKYQPDEMFRYWRSIIEEILGIFIFQFSIPESELDGFSYALDDYPFAIVVNNLKSSVRKIFTIFHEIAHIIKHKPGACVHDFSSDDQFNDELEANNFAGKFLVPKQSIKPVDNIDEVFTLAKKFNISGEVYLWRLLKEDKIERDIFFNWLEKIRSRKYPKKERKGSPSMIIQSKSTRGNKFFNLVTSAVATNRISYSSASDLLGLKVGSIMYE